MATIADILDICDRQKPNAYSDEDKIHWLSKLDGMIFREVLSIHEGAPEAFDGYGEKVDRATRLLADDAYADLYVKWLFAQIDFANAEINRYNNSISMFNALYSGYSREYHRTHMPLQKNFVRGAGRWR